MPARALLLALGLMFVAAAPGFAEDYYQPYVDDPPGSSHGVDYPGNDYQSFLSNKPIRCQSACNADNNCRAWTWVDAFPATSICYLKNGISQPNPNPCCISGKKPLKVTTSPKNLLVPRFHLGPN